MNGSSRPLVAFLSSVRRGLEEERDNLPALIRAIGHECTRFEDYTARPVPSREARLQGIDQADVYVLLVGGGYGDPVFDSGLSPTEEEFTRARQRGIPILVFLKQGVDMEPRQQAFARRVQEYTGGRFRAAYTTVPDLQTKVAQALARLAAEPDALVFTPLPADTQTTLAVPWVYQPATTGNLITSSPVLECHALPLAAPRLPAALTKRHARTMQDPRPSARRDAGSRPGFSGPGGIGRLPTSRSGRHRRCGPAIGLA